MDYALDIIIPKKEVEIVKLNEKLIEWGDIVYPCEPPQYVTDSNIVFEQMQDVKYYSKIVGEELTNDSIILNLKSDILFDLEYVVNSGDKILDQNGLFVFFNRLFELSEFYIILVREDEDIKEQYRIGAKEEIGVRLSDSLRWSNPKDVLLLKKRIDL